VRRTHWRQSVPIASWLFALGVAPCDAHRAGTAAGVELQSWVFPQNRDEGITAFEEPARQAVEYYSERIGPYPYEKLARGN
jgi:aminopeptidase N